MDECDSSYIPWPSRACGRRVAPRGVSSNNSHITCAHPSQLLAAYLHMMSSCNHADLFEAHRHCIADTDRLARLSTSLSDPTQQFPLTILCFGGERKTEALRNLFPLYVHKIRRKVADISLDSASAGSSNPIYIINADRNAKPYDGPDIAKCHEIRSHRIEWRQKPGAVATFQDLIFARLLFLIADVLCIFADDVEGGLQEVDCMLARWISCGPASTLPSSVKPRVLIITAQRQHHEPSLQLDRESIFATATQDAFSDTFSAIKIEDSNASTLRQILFDEIDQACIAKTTAKLLFSARHITWIFRQALIHFCKTLDSPFEHYRCFSPSINTCQLFTHIDAFLSMAEAVEMDSRTERLASYLSSSILIDMYPLGAHGFAANALFDSVYRLDLQHMLDSRPTFASTPSVRLIRDNISSFADAMTGKATAQTLHSRNLVSLAGRLPWDRMQSNSICLGCLKRRPDHCLDCRHALCDDCVLAWGRPVKGLEYTFRLARCPLCLRPTQTTVVLKPPTAGIRVISIDGGGVRGIVPLLFLEVVEKGMGVPLQEYFDMAFGTSSGGLSTLGLFAMKWPLTHCITMFEDLAYQLFCREESLFSQVKTCISTFLCDSRYDAQQLEAILQTQFGRYSRLFGRTPDGWSRYKIAVTATNISDSSTFVLSNYNVQGSPGRRNGYKHFRSDAPPNEVLTWEAARATSAAPFLFPPITLPIGTLQDGGTREHNNPTRLAMWEARQVWPASTMLDVVLSLGTGSGAACDSPQALAYRNNLKDGSIRRSIRSYMHGIDGEVQSRDTVNSLDSDTKTGWFRLNILSQARLDDVEALPVLRESVKSKSCDGDPEIEALRRALLASSFFFELNRSPDLDKHGFLCCTGRLRIRGAAKNILDILHQLSKTTCRFLKGRHLLGDLDPTGICVKCGLFSMPVNFKVRHANEKITIMLQLDECEQRISGFPQCIAWFVQQQNLDTYRDGGPRRSACVCRPAGKKQISKRKVTTARNCQKRR